MLIRLFDENEQVFTTNGIGPLPSAMDCYVSEETNGAFELEMTYPISGKNCSEILNRRLIVCKPNPFENPQAFRIYSISKPINGLIKINAAHISYDLNGITISPFSASSLADALTKIKQGATTTCPFTFWTDKSVESPMSTETPFAIRSVLLGQEGSVLDRYGGEYVWDNFNVRLFNNRGNDRGVLISYGKNLLDIEQEENFADVYTGVHPYYYSENDGLVEVDGKIVKAEGNFSYSNIVTLDLTSKWKEKPTKQQVLQEAQAYIKNNKIGVPKVSIDISFIQLSESKEYALLALLDEIRLGDTVTVRFSKLGIDANAKCISYKYNVLTDRYDTISLGDAKPNLATSLSDQNQASKSNRNYLEGQISSSAGGLSSQVGALSGQVGSLSSDVSGLSSDVQQLTTYVQGLVTNVFDELYVGDTDDLSTATKLWRWTSKGISYSDTGIGGTFKDIVTPTS